MCATVRRFLCRALIGKGLEVTIFDRIVQPNIFSAQQAILDMTLPHLLMHPGLTFRRPLLKPRSSLCVREIPDRQFLIGEHGKRSCLVGLRQLKHSGNGYAGIGWWHQSMRILFLSQYFPPETEIGGHSHFWNSGRRLIAEGIQVSVLTGLPNYPDGKLHPAYRRRRGS